MKKLLIILSLLSTSVLADQSSGSANSNNYNSYRGNVLTVYSNHNVHIVNNEPTEQEFTYTFSLCTNYGHCSSASHKAKLSPSQSYDDKGSLALNEKFNSSGSYPIHSRTEIFGNPHIDVSNYNIVNVY